MESILVKNQKLKFSKEITIDKKTALILVTIRYDDQCGNGHNSFAITNYNGSDHKTIAKQFPELKKYIKWHLMNSDGPTYYIDNTLYHAQKIKTYDYFVYFQDTKFNFKSLVFLTKDKTKIKDFISKYSKLGKITVKVKPNSMNKESQLEYARSSAIWPDANIEDFTEENLLKRLPKLIEDFKKDLKELNLVY